MVDNIYNIHHIEFWIFVLRHIFVSINDLENEFLPILIGTVFPHLHNFLLLPVFFTMMITLTKKLKFFNKFPRNKIDFQMNFLIIIIMTSDVPSFFERLIADLKEFFGLWPWYQWVTSLIGLILLYSITGHIYNKWLSKTMRGHWLSWKTRAWLIFFDLFLNLGLGLYYLHLRETVMGQIMRKCPIAISPAIFVLELLCVTWYYVYYYYLPFSPRWLHLKKKMHAFWLFFVRVKNRILKRKKDSQNKI